MPKQITQPQGQVTQGRQQGRRATAGPVFQPPVQEERGEDPQMEDSEEPEDEISRLRRENEELKKRNEQLVANRPGAGSLTFSVSPQGGISVYGLQRMPVTLYRPSWLRFAAVWEEFLRFLHDATVEEMASTGPADPRYAQAKAEQKARSLAVSRGERVQPASVTNPDMPRMVTRPVPADVH